MFCIIILPVFFINRVLLFDTKIDCVLSFDIKINVSNKLFDTVTSCFF